MIETMIGNSIANQCSPVLMDVKPSQSSDSYKRGRRAVSGDGRHSWNMGDLSPSGRTEKYLASVPEGQTGSIASLAGDRRISEILWLSDRREYT